MASDVKPVGRFGTRHRLHTMGRSGTMPYTRTGETPYIQHRNFGAVIALPLRQATCLNAYRQTNGKPSGMSPPLRKCPTRLAFLRISPESTYKLPQTPGEYPTGAYPPKRTTSAAKRKEAPYHTRVSRLSSTLRANIPGFRFPALTASIGADRADLRAGRGSAKFAERESEAGKPVKAQRRFKDFDDVWDNMRVIAASLSSPKIGQSGL